jgi:hypothetical protein
VDTAGSKSWERHWVRYVFSALTPKLDFGWIDIDCTEQLRSLVAVGELGSPFLGGVLYKFTAYEGMFVISFTALAIDFIMRALLVETKKTTSCHQVEQFRRSTPEDCELTETDTLLHVPMPNSTKPVNIAQYLPFSAVSTSRGSCLRFC